MQGFYPSLERLKSNLSNKRKRRKFSKWAYQKAREKLYLAKASHKFHG